MEEQRNKPTERVQGPEIEYQYIAHLRAAETFANVVSRVGIKIPGNSAHVSFTSPRRLDMRGFKEHGLVWSYSIIRVRKVADVIEEG